MALKIAFTGDNSNFIAKANEARKAVRALQTQVSESLDESKGKMRESSEELEKSRQKLEELQKKYDETGKAAAEMSEKLGSRDWEAMNSMLKDIDKTEQAIRELTMEIERQKKAVEDARKEQEKYKKALLDAQASGDKLGILQAQDGFDRAARAEQEAIANIRDLENALKSFTDALEKENEEFDKIGDGLDRNVIHEFADLTEELEETKEEMDGLSETIDRQTETLAENLEECKKYDQMLERLNEQGKETENAIEKMVGGQKNFDTILRNLPPQLQSAVSGIMGMTKAALAFIATPIGMVIAALGLSLKALMSFFKGTAEGEEQFAKVTGYVQGVLAALDNTVQDVGKQIWRLFTEPKQAISDFGELVKENIINRFKALGKVTSTLGEMMMSLFKGDWEGLKAHTREHVDAWLTIGTGVDNVTQKLGDYISGVNETGRAMANLNKSQLDLDNARMKWLEDKRKLEEEKARLMESANDGSYGERIASMNKVIDLNRQIAEGDRRIAKQQLELTTQKNRLNGDDTLSAKQAESEARAELNKINAAEAEANRSAMSRIVQLRKQIADGEVQLSEAMRAAVKEMIRKEEDNEAALAQAQIDAMNSGDERVRKQRELNHQLAMREIERQKEDEIEAAANSAKNAWSLAPENSNRTWNPSILDASGDDYNKLSDREKQIVDNYTRAVELSIQAADAKIDKYNQDTLKKEQEAMNAYLLVYGNYFQQRDAIRAQHEEKLKSLTEQGDIDAENAQYNQQMKMLEDKFTSTADKLVGIWGKVESRNRKAIREMIKNLKDLQKAMGDKMLTDEEKQHFLDVGLDEDFLEKVKRGEVSFDDLREAVGKLEDESTKLEGVFGKVKKSWSEFKDTGDISAFIGGLQECADVAKSAGGMIGEMADAFGNSKIAESVEDVGNVIDKVFAGASVGGSVGGGWGALAGAVVGLGTGLAQVFAKHADDDYTNRIKELDNQVKRLTRSYEELSGVIDKTFGDVKSRNIESQIANLEKQNALIRQEMYEENQKKHTSQDAITAYQDRIYENKRQIEQLKEQSVDAIFGSDVTSAIENFANAYSEAWAQNTNRTKSAKEQVREMMVQMVRESIKAATESSGAIEAIRTKLVEFFRDGVLDATEQRIVYDAAEELQKKLDEQFGWAGDLLQTSFTDNAVKGAFASMNQETASELNGRFAASQIAIESILQNAIMNYAVTVAISETAQDSNQVLKEVRTLMVSMAGNVEDIAANTKVIKAFGDKLDRINNTLESKL